jgi:ABC-2 type transport system permease protein
VELVLDAEDGAIAGVIQSYVSRILSRYAAELGSELEVADRGGPPTAEPSPGRARIDIRTRGWYNPDREYDDYMVPGILVVLVTMVGVAITSMNIVREKEIGTLEQLNVTPVTRTQFIAGKLIPFSVIALVDLALGLGVARLVFDVPMRGSLLLIFAAAVVYLVAALGIGLWVSTLVETQQQAMFVSFSINMIFLLMSGLFTPVHSMPVWAQWMAELSPVKHFIVIMRSVLVRGAGFADVQVPLYALAAFGAVVLTLAVRQYSKTSG